MSKKLISIAEYKKKVEETQVHIDQKGCVELKQIFFDSILWTTPKAICLKKADKKAWVARKVIVEITISEDENEPCDLWVPTWVSIEWKADE